MGRAVAITRTTKDNTDHATQGAIMDAQHTASAQHSVTLTKITDASLRAFDGPVTYNGRTYNVWTVEAPAFQMIRTPQGSVTTLTYTTAIGDSEPVAMILPVGMEPGMGYGSYVPVAELSV